MEPLNDYEAARAREIAAWKSERPSLLMAAFRGVGRPLSRLLVRFVPDSAVHSLAMKADAVSRNLVGTPGIGSKASGETAARTRSLAECDALAHHHSGTAERRALLEGAIAGIGGILTATLNVPVLLAATQRTIFRIGHCYGYPLDSEEDRFIVLGILELSTADAPERRQAVLQQLLILSARSGQRQHSKPGTEPNTLPVSLAGLEEVLLQDLALGAIPLVGDITWIPMNFDIVRRTDITARRFFQERWLRDRTKLVEIEPSRTSLRRSSLRGGLSMLGHLGYACVYGLSFGAVLPLAVAARGSTSLASLRSSRALQPAAGTS
jgi:hypothetical protein